jgi:hypothetical protein
MKRFGLALFVLAALAAGAFLVTSRDGAHANPDAIITVNSTADTNTRDSVMTLREAIMVATGALPVGDLALGECNEVSGAEWFPFPYDYCVSIFFPPGAAYSDTIVFDAGVFPPGVSFTFINLTSSLPSLDTGNDTIDGSTTGEVVWGVSALFACLTIASDNNTVKGLAIGRCSDGVQISSGQANTIGGSTPGEGNWMYNNNTAGVLIVSGASGNSVKGNLIGTDQDGTGPGPNHWGVALGSGANTIGGSSAAERNVISGNDIGVFLEGPSNIIQGNYIGTNAAGTAAIPNATGLLILSGAQNNTIGGTSAAERNVISGNTNRGVEISDGGNGNSVKGNYIGTNAAGTAAIPNGTGVGITANAQNNTIGGTAAGEGNLIAFNTGNGVEVVGPSTTSNLIRGNSIYSNGGKGIDNFNGGNGEPPPPVITGTGPVTGTVACASFNCTIDIYSDDEDEGRVYEGSTIADDADNWTFAGSLHGPNVTAIAIYPAGNTSEFSTPVEVTEPTPTPSPTPTPTATPGATPTPAGPTRTLQWGPGWNNATWSGASTPEEVFACAAGKYAAAYRYVAGGLERYFPGRPDISNMNPLAQYDAFLILITEPVTCVMPVAAAAGSSRTLQWGMGWQNAGWSGPDGTLPEQAFACAAPGYLSGGYAAAYRYVAGGLERFFPGRADISNMGPLNKYDAFLILLTGPTSCAMPVAP